MGRKKKEGRGGLMGIDQFSELMSAVARGLPRDMDPDVAQGWITNQGSLTRTLREALMPPDYELYFHPTQEGGGVIDGFELFRHLDQTGMIKRASSLESPEVKGWLDNPTTYPDEFKDKVVSLWGSVRESGGRRRVAYLVWYGDRVLVLWRWLGDDWRRDCPALLASSFDF